MSSKTKVKETFVLETAVGKCVLTMGHEVLYCSSAELEDLFKHGEPLIFADIGVIDLDTEVGKVLVSVESGVYDCVVDGSIEFHVSEKNVKKVMEWLSTLHPRRIVIKRRGKISIYDSSLGWVGEYGSLILDKNIVPTHGLLASKKWIEEYNLTLLDAMNKYAKLSLEEATEIITRLLLLNPSIAILMAKELGISISPSNVRYEIPQNEEEPINPFEVKGIYDNVQKIIALSPQGLVVPEIISAANGEGIGNQYVTVIETLIHEAAHMALDFFGKSESGAWLFGMPFGEEAKAERYAKILAHMILKKDGELVDAIHRVWKFGVSNYLSDYIDVLRDLSEFIGRVRAFDNEAFIPSLYSATGYELCFTLGTVLDIDKLEELAKGLDLSVHSTGFRKIVCIDLERW